MQDEYSTLQPVYLETQDLDHCRSRRRSCGVWSADRLDQCPAASVSGPHNGSSPIHSLTSCFLSHHTRVTVGSVSGQGQVTHVSTS
ncbi:hypothetical protein J6590_064234 [Homalodisca vitripennis]|nr:hypothetical protein J6590_064234 [Homalodisca vitripennis]